MVAKSEKPMAVERVSSQVQEMAEMMEQAMAAL